MSTNLFKHLSRWEPLDKPDLLKDKPMTSHFHNTTGLVGPQLRQAEKKQATLAELILRFFEREPSYSFSPSEVWGWISVVRPGTPLTSVRARITELTNDGALYRRDETRTGTYGDPEHTWALAAEGGQMELL